LLLQLHAHRGHGVLFEDDVGGFVQTVGSTIRAQLNPLEAKQPRPLLVGRIREVKLRDIRKRCLQSTAE
jgi:hypothetical protein